MTRTELIDAVRDESWDDAFTARVIHAIETVDLDALNAYDRDLSDIDETTCDDLTLVALSVSYFNEYDRLID